MLTPGVSVSRSSNFRPRIGVDRTVVSSSVLAADVRDVSTASDVAVTLTVSARFETFMLGLSLTVSPTVASTSSSTTVAKPASFRLTR
jgi:hypothetical protein